MNPRLANLLKAVVLAASGLMFYAKISDVKTTILLCFTKKLSCLQYIKIKQTNTYIAWI